MAHKLLLAILLLTGLLEPRRDSSCFLSWLQGLEYSVGEFLIRAGRATSSINEVLRGIVVEVSTQSAKGGIKAAGTNRSPVAFTLSREFCVPFPCVCNSAHAHDVERTCGWIPR